MGIFGVDTVKVFLDRLAAHTRNGVVPSIPPSPTKPDQRTTAHCCHIWVVKQALERLPNARGPREVSKTMTNRQKQVQRQGKIYRFSIAEIEYAAFVWHVGKQFCGRIEGEPRVPQCTGPTALAVRDALQKWLVMHDMA